MLTYAEVADQVGAVVPTHLEAQAAIPVDLSPVQGDLWFRATPMSGDAPVAGDGWVEVPAEGINLVPADIGRNRHILNAVAGSGVLWHPVTGSPRVLGYVFIPQGAVAYATHTEEHGSVGIANPDADHYVAVSVSVDPSTTQRSAD